MLPSAEVKTKDRLSKLQDDLRTHDLSNEERDSLVKICEEFNDTFHLPDDPLTFTTVTQHTIPLQQSPTEYPKYTGKKSKNKRNKCYFMES